MKSPTHRGLPSGIIPATLLLAMALLLAAGCASTPSKQDILPAPDQARLGQDWGIRIQSLRLTAAGHMVDFRYRVLDPDKAAPLFDRNTKPYLLDEASGKALTVPTTAKAGPLRTTNAPQKDRVYWMLFSNPGLIEPGSRVTVAIGDFRAKHLTVQ